jgi:predicted nucleic acid-binding protein
VIIVSDTSPITNLAAINQLDLLQKLYTGIVIPTAVYHEMVRAGKIVPGAVEVQTLPWIQKQAVADPQRVIWIQETPICRGLALLALLNPYRIKPC